MFVKWSDCNYKKFEGVFVFFNKCDQLWCLPKTNKSCLIGHVSVLFKYVLSLNVYADVGCLASQRVW